MCTYGDETLGGICLSNVGIYKFFLPRRIGAMGDTATWGMGKMRVRQAYAYRHAVGSHWQCSTALARQWPSTGLTEPREEKEKSERAGHAAHARSASLARR